MVVQMDQHMYSLYVDFYFELLYTGDLRRTTLLLLYWE